MDCFVNIHRRKLMYWLKFQQQNLMIPNKHEEHESEMHDPTCWFCLLGC